MSAMSSSCWLVAVPTDDPDFITVVSAHPTYLEAEASVGPDEVIAFAECRNVYSFEPGDRYGVDASTFTWSAK